MSPLTRTLAAAALAAAAFGAHAGRPFATEDAGVLAAGECELEPARTTVRDGSGARARGDALQLGCGTPWRSQFALALQRSTLDDGSGGRTRATDVLVGGKTALATLPVDDAALTLAWGATFAKPEPGANRRYTEGFAMLVLSAPLGGPFTAHANLGWAGTRAPRSNATTWALLGEAAVGGGVDVGLEAYGDDRGERWLGAGARWTAGAWSLNAAIARGRAAEPGQPRPRLTTVGAKFSF